MLQLARGGFTDDQIKDALHGKRGSRKIRFRYDLLDKNENKKQTLTSVIGGEVKFSALNDIKRTASFTIKDDPAINWLSDRIQPFVEVLINNTSWVEFPLGVFLPSSPTRDDTTGGAIRSVEAYDGLTILIDDKLADIYTVTAGTNIKTAVIAILTGAGITKYIIEDTTKTVSIDMQYEVGTPKISVINDLLSQINFTPIRVDVNGYFTSNSYISPSLRPIEYTYKDDELSVTYRGMQEELDLFDTPNQFIVVRTNSEETPLKSVYTNSNAASPTSTVSRGRTIVDYREIDNISDQSALDSYTQRIAFEASQVYGKLNFETAIMPMHDYYDILKIEYGPLGVNDKYTETSWSIPLEVGGRMKHEVRKVVSI
jgi:hypothetical protein